jgi:hypothetical protein
MRQFVRKTSDSRADEISPISNSRGFFITFTPMKEDIQAEFVRGYFDLGIYRFVVRNWRVLKPVSYSVFGVIGIAILLAATGVIALKTANVVVVVGGVYLVALVWLAAIDHMIIGFSLRRILKRLEKRGIVIPDFMLLKYCEDILPK